MNAKLLIGILACALLLAASPALLAQGDGRIEGRITRPDGSAVSGVIVEIRELARIATTGGNGRYAFSGVPPGTYTLGFTLGENAETAEGVEVASGATATADRQVDWELSFLEAITVTSASRRAERITEAPAAVTVVTEQEIEREAAHGQLPKLLEFTPGAEVTQSGIYDYNFNTRGFNSSLNRRVATLIDGRDPSVPFLGAQEWAAVSFPLDDLASLELVRGPSAALYGANASSGVLNMVTKQPRYSQGGFVRLTAGELSTTNADLRWAGEIGAGWYFKVTGGVRDSGDFTVSRNESVEYAGLPREAVPLAREDDNEISFGGLRFDKTMGNGDFLSIEGGTANIAGPVFQTGIGRVQVVDAERPWARINYSAPRWNFLGYYNGRDAPEQLALASGNNLALDSENYQFELQTNWDFADGRARIVAGATYGEEDIDSFDPAVGRQTLIFRPISSDQQAVYAQLDWDLSDSLKLVVAGRWDDSSLHDSQFSPKGSLVWGLSPEHSLRFTYNEAFQVANYSEFFLQAQVGAFPGAPLNGVCALFGESCGFPDLVPVLALGNETLAVEKVKTFEIGYSGILGQRAFLTLDYYNGRNQSFITDLLPQLGTALGRTNPNFGPYSGVSPQLAATLDGVIGMFVPGAAVTNNVDGSPIIAAVSYTNFGDVDTQGVDFSLNYHLPRGYEVSFAYSWFDFDVKNDLPGFQNLLVPNTPENKATLGFTYVGDRFDAGISGRWVDDFLWAVGPFVGQVDSYITADLNANYVINPRFKVGINVSDLFDEQHFESFGGDILERRALAHVEVTW